MPINSEASFTACSKFYDFVLMKYVLTYIDFRSNTTHSQYIASWLPFDSNTTPLQTPVKTSDTTLP